MSITRSTRRGAFVAATIGALFGLAGLATGQVPVKPAPKDTVAKVKQAGKTKAATPKIKIAKEQTSGGEVVPVIEISKPCDTVTKVVVTFDPLRDDSIRL